MTLTPSRREFVKGQLDKVTAVINNTPSNWGTTFYSSGVHDLPPCQGDENAWSSRLAGALGDFLPEHLSGAVEYTAEDGPKFSIKQTLKSGIPNTPHLVSCYPFKGASDALIKNTPLVIGQKVTSENGASASCAGASGSDGETSGEECNVHVEYGKQADSLSSPQPQKLGELKANMHISLLQKNYQNVPPLIKQSKIQDESYHFWTLPSQRPRRVCLQNDYTTHWNSWNSSSTMTSTENEYIIGRYSIWSPYHWATLLLFETST